MPASLARAVCLLVPRLSSWIHCGLLAVFHGIQRLTAMSYRDLSTPLPGYVPLARLKRGYRSRGSRPLSDGDLWAVCLPTVTSTPYRSITDHSCLKVYHKDPAQAFNHGARPANGDARVSEPPTNQPSARPLKRGKQRVSSVCASLILLL